MNESTILFWVLAGILMLLSLAFILPALLRKPSENNTTAQEQNILIAKEHLKELQAEYEAGKISQEVYQQSYNELQRTLLDDVTGESAGFSAGRSKVIAAVVALVVPLAAISLYMQLGTSIETIKSASQAPASNEHDMQSFDVLAERLAAKLKTQPDDARGWDMLGRTYLVMKRYDDAAQAFAKADKLAPGDPELMLRYADALVMSRGGNFQGQPAELINKALQQQPTNITALWLAGMAAEQQGNFELALAHWQKILPFVNNEPQTQAQVQTMISRVKARLPAQSMASNESQPVTPASRAALQIKVSLDSSLSDKVAPGDTVFVFAKAPNGPPMPLAVARHTASELPLTVTLDDTSAMMPAMKLSNFEKVNVSARVSKSGNAIAQSGDFYGEVNEIAVSSDEPITIVVNKQKP